MPDIWGAIFMWNEVKTSIWKWLADTFYVIKNVGNSCLPNKEFELKIWVTLCMRTITNILRRVIKEESFDCNIWNLS